MIPHLKYGTVQQTKLSTVQYSKLNFNEKCIKQGSVDIVDK